MNSYFGLSIVAIFMFMIVLGGIAHVRRQINKRLQNRLTELCRGVSDPLQLWFAGWLANQRQSGQPPITRETRVSQEEVRAGVETAKRKFNAKTLFYSTDIQNVGDFVDMLDRQLQHKGTKIKSAKFGRLD